MREHFRKKTEPPHLSHHNSNVNKSAATKRGTPSMKTDAMVPWYRIASILCMYTL